MPYKRYSDSVQRYYRRQETKTCTPKEKKEKKKHSGFEKKLLVQAIISILLLGYCVSVSKFSFLQGQREFIHNSININATSSDVKSFLSHTARLGLKGGEYAKKGVEFIERLCTPKDSRDDTASVTALAKAGETEGKKAEEDTLNTEVELQKTNSAPKYVLPAQGRISSEFGEREHPVNGEERIHWGIDIAGNHGDTVVSAGEGIVDKTGTDPGLGNYIKVLHPDGIVSVYGHLSLICVKEGEWVNETVKIGEIGSSGVSTGPHLHFEMRVEGESRNPFDYLNKTSVTGE